MKIRIFVASPGDVSEERGVLADVVEGIRRTIGDIREVELETVRWETHAWPAVGDDAQDVINREIGKFDILVGIMWKRYGTPTNRSTSGTGEEFERAYDLFRAYKRPKIMFYFRTTPFYSKSEKELSQFRKVIRFRRKLEKLGVLFWEYNEPLDFERNVREHLIRQILELTEPTSKPSEGVGPFVFMSTSREDSNRVIPVYRTLASAGFNPWLDVENLVPGQDWYHEIESAIKKSDFVIVFVSEATESRKGFVHKEIQMAIKYLATKSPSTPYLIPVRLDAVIPPTPLLEYQWVDLFSEEGTEKLIFALRAAWKARERNVQKYPKDLVQ